MSTSEPKLIQNAVRFIEDDYYLVSSHVHDWREHTLPDGVSNLFVDGGLEYARRGGTLLTIAGLSRYEERCLSDADPFEHIAEWLVWGTRGLHGDQPFTFRPIKTLSTDHLVAILANVPDVGDWHRRVIQHWIDQRLTPSTRGDVPSAAVSTPSS